MGTKLETIKKLKIISPDSVVALYDKIDLDGHSPDSFYCIWRGYWKELPKSYLNCTGYIQGVATDIFELSNAVPINLTKSLETKPPKCNFQKCACFGSCQYSI